MMTDDDSDGFYNGDDNLNGVCDTGEACSSCSNTGTSGDPACLFVRNVAISLTGELAADSSVTQTVTTIVRIRNDKFINEVL